MAIDEGILKLIRTNLKFINDQDKEMIRNMSAYERNVFKLVKKHMAQFTVKDGKVDVDENTLNSINSLDKAILKEIRIGKAGKSDDTYMKDVKKYLKSFDQVQKHQEEIQHEVNDLPYESERVSHRMGKDDDFNTNLSDMTKGGDLIPEDFYTHPQYYGKLNDKATKESWDVIKKMKGDPDGEVTIYRGIPKDGIDKIHQGEWISLSKTYAQGEAPDGKVIQQKVKASEVIWDGNDMNEFSFYPESVEQNKTMEELVEPFKKQMIEDTLQGLTGSGVNDAFVVPIREQLFKNAVAGVTIDEMEKSIKTFIEGNDQDVGKFSAYVGQIARDSLNQYDGMINQQMAKDYNLDAYQYVGSLKGTSRPQCKRWVAMGVLLKEDLSKLLHGSPMQGLIPETNENNFAVFRGGYNCRHTAIPFRMTTRERKRYDSKQYKTEIEKKVKEETNIADVPASQYMDLTYDRKVEFATKIKHGNLYPGYIKPKALKDNPELDVLPDQYWEMFEKKGATQMPTLQTSTTFSSRYVTSTNKVILNIKSNHTPIAQKQTMIHEFAHAQEKQFAKLEYKVGYYLDKNTGKKYGHGRPLVYADIDFQTMDMKSVNGGWKLKSMNPKYEEHFQESRKLFKAQEKADKKAYNEAWESTKGGILPEHIRNIVTLEKGTNKGQTPFRFRQLKPNYWSIVNEYKSKYKGLYSQEDISEFLCAYTDTVMALSYEKYGLGHSKNYFKKNGGAGRRFEFYVHSAENFWQGNPIFRDENPALYELMIKQYKNINNL